MIESQEIKENHATNSSSNEWSPSSIEQGLITMDRQRKSTETEEFGSPDDQGSDDESKAQQSGFNLGVVKSNSVVARASMWQQLQQQAKGKKNFFDLVYSVICLVFVASRRELRFIIHSYR